jgi:hypothetical protein
MGTSKGYSMPTGGNWGPLKREATEYAQNVGVKPVAPQSLLRHYIRVRSNPDGPRGGAEGGGNGAAGSGGGGGGRSAHWGAGAATAQRIGGFLSRVGQVGLGEALREVGLGDLVGRSAAEISAALLDRLAGPASTLDQDAARHALVDLNDELLAEAETFEEVEKALAGAVDSRGLFDILLRFFGHYLYECFCRDFYERLVKKVGSAQAGDGLKGIRDCIDAAVEAKLVGRDKAAFEWHGPDGKKLAAEILGEVLDIFELTT